MGEIKLLFPSAGNMLRFIVAEEVSQVALSTSEHAIFGVFSQQLLCSACAFYGASAVFTEAPAADLIQYS